MVKRIGLSVAVLMGCASPSIEEPMQSEAAKSEAIEASSTLIEAIESVEGSLGVKTARAHDGTELIFAWFKDRDAVIAWFEHPYHRKLLRDAGRPEDHIAAEHYGSDVGPILIVASVAYNTVYDAYPASMFDDPAGRRPTRFAIEYYVPLPGGAYMIEPFAPPSVQNSIPNLRDVFADE